MDPKTITVRLDDLIEEREHGEDSDKHDKIDDRWVASQGHGDHVTTDGHDQQGPEELRVSVSSEVNRASSTYLKSSEDPVGEFLHHRHDN